MQQILWEGNTAYGRYQVVDGQYDGRPARVLYSGDRQAAQSGMAQDGQSDLLFDYNQRLFELAQVQVPQSVLIVGGGVGTFATALHAVLPDTSIDLVEPDQELTQLGHDFFDLPVDAHIRVWHTDGRSFMRQHADCYDMIVVDAFTHTTIPADLKTVEAFQSYRDHLCLGGVLAANVISGYYGPSAHVLKHLYAAARTVFGMVDVSLAGRGCSLWLPQNFVLVGYDDPAVRPIDYMRSVPIKPPRGDLSVALHDAE